MMRHLFAFALVLSFGVVSPLATASACRSFGTQLECDLGTSELLLGTQTDPNPTYGQPYRVPRFQEGADVQSVSEWPLRIQLQNIGSDPTLCRKIGNETYCY